MRFPGAAFRGARTSEIATPFRSFAMHRPGVRHSLALVLQALMWFIVAFASLSILPARAQQQPSPEELRVIEFGKEIFKVKAQCQYCHKWDGGGDQGYGGIALSLRKTQLT